MRKISIHSFIFFTLLILKPWKNFHDLVLYYFICYKARVKREPSVNKRELIFRYAKIADSKIIFRHLFFMFRTPEHKEDKDLLITIFNNAADLVIELFDKDELTKEDTNKLSSDYFELYHSNSNKSHNINLNIKNRNYQANNQYVKINNTQNYTQNKTQNNFVTSIESTMKENNSDDLKSKKEKNILQLCIERTSIYAQKINGKIKAKIVASYLFSTGLLDDTLDQIEKTKYLSELIKIKLTPTKHIEDPTYFRKGYDSPESVLNNLSDISDFFITIDFEKAVEFIKEDIQSIKEIISEK